MSNAIWGKIHIGGTITKRQVKDIMTIIGTTFGSNVFEDYIENDCFQIGDPHAPEGEFPELEEYCCNEDIDFIRYSDENLNMNSNGIIKGHIPSIGKHFMVETGVGGEIIIPADPLQLAVKVVEEVTKEKAPLSINSNNLYGEYAKHLLSGGTALEFLVNFIKGMTPEIPTLPKLKIVARKRK